jgi:peptidoglycan hydrolase CwlO-like protein
MSVTWSLLSKNQLIEQNNKTIQQQIQNVTDLNSQVSSKEQKVDELQNQNIKLISLIDEKDLHIAQLSADLERANTILRKINSTPVIRHLLRMLNIK